MRKGAGVGRLKAIYGLCILPCTCIEFKIMKGLHFTSLLVTDCSIRVYLDFLLLLLLLLLCIINTIHGKNYKNTYLVLEFSLN